MNNIKYVFVEVEGNHNDLQIDFDEGLFESLVRDDGWTEFTKTISEGKVQHLLFSPNQRAIRCIKWIE